MIVIAGIIAIFVHIYHMIGQFVIINLCEVITTRFNTVNLVLGINCGPINFTFIQYFCIIDFHTKIFDLLDKLFRNIYLSCFTFFIRHAICLVYQKFSYWQLMKYICPFRIVNLRENVSLNRWKIKMWEKLTFVTGWKAPKLISNPKSSSTWFSFFVSFSFKSLTNLSNDFETISQSLSPEPSVPNIFEVFSHLTFLKYSIMISSKVRVKTRLGPSF